MPTGERQKVVQTTEVQIFDISADNGACRGFFVGVHPDSPNPSGVVVRVVPLHQSNEGVPVYVGGSRDFYSSDDGPITEVYVQGVGGSGIIDYGIISK